MTTPQKITLREGICQDGAMFYYEDAQTGALTLITSYPELVGNDFDMAGAAAARERFAELWPELCTVEKSDPGVISPSTSPDWKMFLSPGSPDVLRGKSPCAGFELSTGDWIGWQGADALEIATAAYNATRKNGGIEVGLNGSMMAASFANYDGAPDTKSKPVGVGRTALEAIVSLFDHPDALEG